MKLETLPVDGAKRTVAWELPARDPEVRQSLVRQYGTRKIDGASDAADVGDADDSMGSCL